MKAKSFVDDLEYRVTGACIEVHRVLGAGLLESIYHKCLVKELHFRGIISVSDQIVSVNYKGDIVNTELRADLFIEDCLVVELKAVEAILPVHEAQLLTYMKLLRAPKGLLINFNCTNIIQYGKKSFVNNFYRDLI